MSHYETYLTSEPASSSLQPALRKNTLSEISYQKRPKNVAKWQRFDKWACSNHTRTCIFASI